MPGTTIDGFQWIYQEEDWRGNIIDKIIDFGVTEYMAIYTAKYSDGKWVADYSYYTNYTVKPTTEDMSAGKIIIDREGIVFTILYSDFDPEAGTVNLFSPYYLEEDPDFMGIGLYNTDDDGKSVPVQCVKADEYQEIDRSNIY